MDGDAALALIREACPNTDVVALSALEWATKGPGAPDAALEKGRESWMELLLPLVATLASERLMEFT